MGSILSSSGDPKPSNRKIKRKSHWPLDYQVLEPRQVLNAAPIANDDLLYFTSVNTALAGNLISNDFDAEGDSLSATLVGSAPASGDLVLNSNGSFTFTPNTGFEGVASWEYKVSDGSLDSRVARAQVLVGLGLSGATERGLIHSDNPLHTGAQTLIQDLGHENKLIYRTDQLGSTIIQVEAFAMLAGLTPTSISAQLFLDGEEEPKGYSSLQSLDDSPRPGKPNAVCNAS